MEKVKGLRFIPLLAVMATGALLAVSCAAEQPTPTPTPTATPRPGVTPIPTATPRPGVTLTPTATPRPGVTPTPTLIATPTPTATPPPTPTPGPIKGGTLLMVWNADPVYLDPTRTTSHDYDKPIQNMTANLVRSVPNDWLKVVPDLATGWEVSGDGRIYTFKMRPGLKWADGQPITAADADYTFYRWLKRPNKLPAPRQACFREMVASTRMVDTLTVEITLKEPRGAFIPCLGYITYKLVPKHIAEPIDLGGGRDFTLEELAASVSGPFKHVKYVRGSYWYLTRNTNYYLWETEGRPYVDNLNFYQIVDGGSIVAAFRTKNLHMTFQSPLLTPEQGDDLKREFGDKVVVHSAEQPAYGVFWFNMNEPPFNDVRLRKAVHLVHDRQATCDLAFGGRCTYVFPMLTDWDWIHPRSYYESLPGWRQPKDADIAEAKRLVDEATGGKGVDAMMLIRAFSYYSDLSQVLQQQLQKVGIRLTLDPQEQAAGRILQTQGKFLIMFGGLSPVYLDPDGLISALYVKGASYNYQKWEDPRVEGAHAAQSVLTKNEDRVPYLRKIVDVLLEELPYLFTVRDMRTVAWWAELKGIETYPPLNSVEHRFDYVWLER